MANDRPSEPQFVSTAYVESLVGRALTYLRAGLSVHLQGPAGTGKTTLALHLAAQLEQPVHLLYGNEEFQGFELVGKVTGVRTRYVLDNFIHNVEKRREEIRPLWLDGRLLKAVRDGGTLVYDEFTRSRAEANNVLLSVLEEGVLEVPDPVEGLQLVPVHPDFRLILTSNDEEYAGVHRSQDALRDRLVTLALNNVDDETLIEIVAIKGDLYRGDAAEIVHAVRHRLTAGGDAKGISPLRAALMVARVVSHLDIRPDERDPLFAQICDDITGIASADGREPYAIPDRPRRRLPSDSLTGVDGVTS